MISHSHFDVFEYSSGVTPREFPSDKGKRSLNDPGDSRKACREYLHDDMIVVDVFSNEDATPIHLLARIRFRGGTINGALGIWVLNNYPGGIPWKIDCRSAVRTSMSSVAADVRFLLGNRKIPGAQKEFEGEFRGFFWKVIASPLGDYLDMRHERAAIARLYAALDLDAQQDAS